MVVGAQAIADAVPPDLLTVWASTTGLAVSDLARAWTRVPRSERQWVVESDKGERWVVFSRGTGDAGVISLSDAERRRGRRPSRR